MKPAHNPHLPVWFTIMGLALFSCNNPQPEAYTLLEAAEQLADSRPDSALQLIDSIIYPEKSFREKDYMRYCVTRVQARYKNHLPVHEDTLIFRVREYFTKHSNDPVKTTLACFYSGCVYREQGNKEQASNHYKDAETYAGISQNDSFSYYSEKLSQVIEHVKENGNNWQEEAHHIFHFAY